ncbi:PII family protein [Alkalihalophilus pseudofirmus]|uniref:P-II family nitrogen regulator n=1 Tax=Alkalihalophilus pseudofirmus TaxID=79885 RepID=UPI00259B07BB|nr:P-II family nitrogen regulator [Alkalihalophilus pseudofirmus]WEG18448.1 PII family protein [Alkalihalophilus pseudofirmus]
MKLRREHQLFVSIVKKHQAKKLVLAAKKAGAEGATILYAKGSGIREKKTFLGIPVHYEKEVILTIAKKNVMEQIIYHVTLAGNLNQSGKGIGFVLDLKQLTGIAHLLEDPADAEDTLIEEDEGVMPKEDIPFDLIVTIVKKGDAGKVIDSSLEAGAEGGTVLGGRGSGIHEKASFLNIPIEPEKEVVLTLIHRKKTKEVLHAIELGVGLNQSGKGIAFVLDVDRVVGINHVIDELKQIDE